MMFHRSASGVAFGRIAIVLVALLGILAPFAATQARAEGAAVAPDNRPYLLHLPGIGGSRSIDRMLVTGLAQGGVDAETEIYDWTGEIPGLTSLYARDRNEAEAARVADAITTRFRAAPTRRIYLTCHSGGAGIVAWALERLPDDVLVESVVFIAPALSPGYDLSKALAHVRAKAYVLSSAYDPVLGAGTRMFGTIDGIKTDAAGRVGFNKPAEADAGAYAKLVAIPYDPAWARFRNLGDHIGPMMRPFAKEVVARLLLTGELPVLAPLTTRPASARPTTAPASAARRATPAH